MITAPGRRSGIIFAMPARRPELMPMPISLSINCKAIVSAETGSAGYLRPAGKAQVTVEYDNNVPIRVDTIVLPPVTARRLNGKPSKGHVACYQKVIRKNCLMETVYLINPTGRELRPGGLRFNRQENHCRHLRRLLPARRRCLLRKGSDKG